MQQYNYTHPKCGHKNHIIDDIRAASGFWSKILDIQTKKFSSVTSQYYPYNEFYKTKPKSMTNIFDLFTN